MKTYQIAGITFGIHYCYDEYLKDNIEAYEIQGSIIEHTLKVVRSDSINHPEGETKSTKNPYTMYQDGKRIIYVKDKYNNIKSCVKHDLEYKKVQIKINPRLTENAAEIEYTWLGLMFMEIALKHKLLPFHATAINDHGKAILILAPSQTGKSTHARLWKEIDDQIEIINDDKPLVGLINNELFVYSSPFSGKSSLNQNRTIPLHAMVFLYQGNKDEIISITKDEIIKEMMKNMMRPSDERAWSDAINIMNILIEKTQILRLNATLNQSAAKLLKKMLDEGE